MTRSMNETRHRSDTQRSVCSAARSARNLALTVAVATAAGCDDTTGPTAGATDLGIAFAVQSAALATFSGTAAMDLQVAGTNGTLVIDDLRLIVSEFELEAEDEGANLDDACSTDDDASDEDDCLDFHFPPFLLDVPLSGGIVEVGSADVPPGVYEELEFETRGLDDDEDDDEVDRARVLELITELRATYPGFPERASMVARGTFTPTDGEPRPFVVYFDAEVEVELEFEPAIVLPAADGSALVVDIRPDLWFRSGDSVIDLSQWDGRFVELEFEMERGFESVEFED